MQKFTADSSVIAAGIYDGKDLIVKFNSGAYYRYNGVPAQVFMAFRDSDSKGMYFNQYIKNNYAYQRIAGSEVPQDTPEDDKDSKDDLEQVIDGIIANAVAIPYGDLARWVASHGNEFNPQNALELRELLQKALGQQSTASTAPKPAVHQAPQPKAAPEVNPYDFTITFLKDLLTDISAEFGGEAPKGWAECMTGIIGIARYHQRVWEAGHRG